ncbi:Crp/Fnr family transcriptional regulator [Ovoidimarina sediminis]|uniref:Crp/Fnr family transcriptional regulator n=1 Tax=Ovoidimarina sediminis TaxID=3079856 RepID=UPI00291333A4|nr:cyclic nucleotide-binding domain-containing protein [Rhodophyticola sp. MJ-SS7]MDU8943738.1 cyclic nucleotide-binding domain-containing protein [Rhodophyticola sp. MJ-SS7]
MTRCASRSDTGAPSLSELFETSGIKRRFNPGATIAAQGERQAWVYMVARGCVRSCIYSPEGHRRVVRFRGPGSVLGLGLAAEWTTSEEAVDMAVLEAIPVAAFEAMLAASPAAQRDLHDRMREEIEAHAALLVLTSNSSAVDRVREFLKDFARSRKSGGLISLPMSRRDIGDHLALSMESVCRAISTLKRDGEIDLKGASFFRFPEQDAGGLAVHCAA